MSEIACPNCGSTRWNAIEQIASMSPCSLIRDEDGTVEIEPLPQSEFVRDAATSVTVAYTCGNEDCGHTVAPEDLPGLGGPA
jgi:succinate dehydrogenase/fumarate reductase-like Fe-S protein